MAVQTENINFAAAREAQTIAEPSIAHRTNSAFSTTRFDYINVTFAAILIVGLFVDGWAHLHFPLRETFFTPWHGILYSGFTLLAIVLVSTAFNNYRRGIRWTECVPKGYRASLLGVPLFFIGGIGDFIGHSLLGNERGVEAVISPTHLILAFSGILLVGGPFRAAWQKRDSGWIKLLPMVISLMLVYSMITGFTQYGHPLYNIWSFVGSDPNIWIHQAFGVTGIVLQSALLTAVIAIMVRHWSPPRGAFLLVIGVNTILSAFIVERYSLMIGGVVAGLVIEIIWMWLRPTMQKIGVIRIFLAAVPFVYYLLFFTALHLTMGITWPPYMWSGALAMAALTGYFLSFTTFPPAIPENVQTTN